MSESWLDQCRKESCPGCEVCDGEFSKKDRGSKMTGKNFQIVGNDISDGSHTFDELYAHRCLLFINLCLLQPDRAYWRPHYEGWPLIGLETEFGQITYHVPEKYLYLFLDKIKQGGPEWDGHESKDSVDRLEWIARTK